MLAHLEHLAKVEMQYADDGFNNHGCNRKRACMLNKRIDEGEVDHQESAKVSRALEAPTTHSPRQGPPQMALRHIGTARR